MTWTWWSRHPRRRRVCSSCSVVVKVVRGSASRQRPANSLVFRRSRGPSCLPRTTWRPQEAVRSARVLGTGEAARGSAGYRSSRPRVGEACLRCGTETGGRARWLGLPTECALAQAAASARDSSIGRPVKPARSIHPSLGPGTADARLAPRVSVPGLMEVPSKRHHHAERGHRPTGGDLYETGGVSSRHPH